MAFPTGWLAKHKIIIDHTKVSGGANLTNFPVLLAEGNFLAEAFSNSQGKEIFTNALYSDANLQGYWRLESDGTDETSNNNDLTGVNTPTHSTGKFGNGVDLEASSSQYYSIADASQTGLDITGDISISAWIKLGQLPSTVGANFSIVTKDNTGVDRSYDWNILSASNKMRFFYCSETDGSPNTFCDANYVFGADDLGKWMHVAVVVDVSSATVIFYMNGVVVSTTYVSQNATSIANSATDFIIGARKESDVVAGFFDGVIDDVAIWDRALTDEEVLGLYTGGQDLRFSSDEAGTTELAHEVVNWDIVNSESEVWVKIPTLSYTADTYIYVWYNNATAELLARDDTYGSDNVWNSNFKFVSHGGGVTDSTSYAITPTVSGATDSVGKIGAAKDFDGADDYISLGSPAHLDNLAQGALTMSVWINPDSTGEGGTARILDKRNASPGTDTGDGFLWYINATNRVVFQIVGGGAGSAFGANDMLSAGWNHVVATVDGTTGEVRLFANGAEVSYASQASGLGGTDASGQLTIGNNGVTTRTFEGDIDEVRIQTTEVTDGWIATEYANQNSPATFAGAVAERTFTETVTISGTVAKGIQRLLSEALSIVDGFTRVFTGNRTFTEVVTIVQIGFSAAFGRVLTEVISLSDNFSRIFTGSRVFSETVAVTDALLKGLLRRLSETISLSVTFVKSLSRVFLETISLSQIFSKGVTMYRTFTETIVISGVLTKLMARVFTETLVIVDTGFSILKKLLKKLLRVTRVDNSKLNVKTKKSTLDVKEQK
jgi:hypothetical protein